MDKLTAREKLLGAAAGYLSIEKSYETHPEDPHGDASMELAEEILDDAVKEYSKFLEFPDQAEPERPSY